jgi:hypothetical protein
MPELTPVQNHDRYVFAITAASDLNASPILESTTSLPVYFSQTLLNL